MRVLFLIVAAQVHISATDEVRAVVTQVHSGSMVTYRDIIYGTTQTILLEHVDTLPTSTKLGRLAADCAREATGSGPVTILVSGMLGKYRIGDVAGPQHFTLSELLASDGLAWVNVGAPSHLRYLEKQASDAKVGLWAVRTEIHPSRWILPPSCRLAALRVLDVLYPPVATHCKEFASSSGRLIDEATTGDEPKTLVFPGIQTASRR